MEKRPKRKLDLAKPASLDIVSLNNKVIVMKSTVRKAKAQVIQKLIRKMKTYRQKRGSEEQVAKNHRKAERFVEDMEAIKKLKLVKVAKYALANTTTFAEICKKAGAPPETRALARLSEHRLMVKDVQDFRDKHEDWRSLADFFLTHVSRRYKKHKHLESKTKMTVNVQAGNEMMKTYLTNKLGKDTSATKEDDKGSSPDANVKKKSKKLLKNDIASEGKAVTPLDDTELDSEHSNDSDECNQSEGGSEGHGDDNAEEEGENEQQKPSEDENSVDNSDNSDMSDGEDLKVRGETVVKKLDMNDLLTSNEGDIPGFLVSLPEEENVTKTKKLKDSFFMGSDGESFNDDVDNDQSDSDESEIDLDEKRTSGKNAIRTTFVGALNSEKSRGRKFDNFRGRGRGDRFNGERQYNNYSNDRSRGRGQYGSYGDRGRGRGQYGNFGDRGRSRGQYGSYGDKSRGRGQYGSYGVRGRGMGRGNFRRDDDRQQRYESRGRGGYHRGSSDRNPRDFTSSGSRGRGNQFQPRNTEYTSKTQRTYSVESKGGQTGEKIHPSWEASKKRKEHSNIQAFQGKKIKFDDD